MSEQGVKKKAGYNWPVLVVVVVAAVVWYGWNWPRIGWSVEVDPGEQMVVGDTRPDVGFGTEIKHVVVISMDTTRADHFGSYGYSRDTTPNIDAVAVDGVRFNHTISAVPLTFPSHSSVFTGTIPPYHKVRLNDGYMLGDSNITLAEILKDNGFATGAVIGAVVLDSQFGIDQGFDMYDDDIEIVPGKSMHDNERSAPEVTRRAIRWLEANRGRKSFLFAHYFDPHGPYDLHEEHLFQSYPFLSNDTDRYDSEIAYTDAHIGKIVNKLKTLGIYDSTLLIIMSDHGEDFKQHGEESHGFYIYHSTVNVALVMRVPGGPKGKVYADVSGLIDIVPTVCGALGIDIPEHVQGVDLFDKTSFGKQRYVYSESLYPLHYDLGTFAGFTGNRWKYIHTSKPELFDLSKDIGEKKNLYDTEKDQAGLMQGELMVLLNEMSEAGATATRFVADAEMVERLKSLGYVSGTVDDNVDINDDRPNPRENFDIFLFSNEFKDLTAAKEFEKAKKLCYKMLKKRPGLPEAYYDLGLIGGYQKDFDSLLEHNHKYISLIQRQYKGNISDSGPLDKLANAYANIASVYLERKDFVKSVEYIGRALELEPDSKAYSDKLAEILRRKGQ